MSGLVERLRQVFAEHGDVLETHLLRLEARVDALRAIQEAHATALADLRFAVAAKEPVVGFFVVPTTAGLAEWAQYPRTYGPFSGASARFVPGEAEIEVAFRTMRGAQALVCFGEGVVVSAQVGDRSLYDGTGLSTAEAQWMADGSDGVLLLAGFDVNVRFRRV